MFPIQFNKELEAYFSNELFRLKTQRQIAKDFESHGFSFNPEFCDEVVDIQQLSDKVLEALMYVVEKKASSWQPLLYTIDISEKVYIQYATSQEQNWMQLFGWEVIRREAQKVFFREKYSK
ncbi:MAG: hypothetical protein RL728_110 [Bacteroidota bacterium]|jgi:hypothetical protein